MTARRRLAAAAAAWLLIAGAWTAATYRALAQEEET